MQSQKIQAFNAQFEQYEGEISGSQVNTLVQTAIASNASDSAHQVYVAYVSTVTYGMSGPTLDNYLKKLQIIDSKKYKVELHYANDSQDYFRVPGYPKILVGVNGLIADVGYINGITVYDVD